MSAKAATKKRPAPPNEAEARKLRDQVFGHAATDKNWEACKERWMTPEAMKWLRTTAQKGLPQ